MIKAILSNKQLQFYGPIWVMGIITIIIYSFAPENFFGGHYESFKKLWDFFAPFIYIFMIPLSIGVGIIVGEEIRDYKANTDHKNMEEHIDG